MTRAKFLVIPIVLFVLGACSAAAPPLDSPPPPKCETPPVQSEGPAASASVPAAPAPLAGAKQAKPSPPPKTFDIAAIDNYLREKANEKGVVGLSVAIVKDGKLVLAKGYGKRSLNPDSPAEPTTAFGIGSITKQFVAASIFLLAEDKKLSVDDKVAKYFPKLTRAGDIKLYDLMTHGSGYRDYYPLDFVSPEMTADKSVDAVIEQYATRPLDFEPGTRFSYSNTGYLILGRIVEKVSGEPLGRFMERRIFKPLGMIHSELDPKRGAPSQAIGYSFFAAGDPEPAVPEGNGWLHAAGGLFASAEDIAKWDMGLMDAKVLKPASFERMSAPRTLSSGRTKDYGGGLGIARRSSETVLIHSGAVSGFLAYNAFIPRLKSAVVLLSNAEHWDVQGIHNQLLSLLLQEQADPIPEIQGPPPDQVALDMLHQMQSGVLNRKNLGDDINAYLSDARVREAAPRLKALGEPKNIEIEGTWERGGMMENNIRITFEHETLKASLFRTPDGKVQQFLLRR